MRSGIFGLALDLIEAAKLVVNGVVAGGMGVAVPTGGGTTG